MLRGAIIGLGNVALHGHLPGWLSRADIEIVAVTDTDPARRATWAERLPAARWNDSPEQLMGGTSLDFVDICTPPSSHAVLIRQALAHRLHVLCEKPLVGSLPDLYSLVEQAAGADRVLHTVHNWHHAPIVRQTRALVADRAIGQRIDESRDFAVNVGPVFDGRPPQAGVERHGRGVQQQVSAAAERGKDGHRILHRRVGQDVPGVNAHCLAFDQHLGRALRYVEPDRRAGWGEGRMRQAQAQSFADDL